MPSFRVAGSAAGGLASLDGALGVGVRAWLPTEEALAWARRVHAAREAWTAGFHGEQFSLGRAFYTDFEDERSDAYFADAGSSNARVERALPGMQQRLVDLVAELTGGRATSRRGWCGPGVHIFPAGEKVAREGGVVHFDTEGLTRHHVVRRRRALTCVVVIQAADEGGGLRLWDVLYQGHDHPTEDELRVTSEVVPYGAGDLVVIDSYRLHQIQPFTGSRPRISATVHAAEVDPGLWETWF